MNPDCEQGKHTACSGDAWDFARDAPKACGCDCHIKYVPGLGWGWEPS